jgi:hypothetical protein
MPTYGLSRIESLSPSETPAQDAMSFGDLFIMGLKLVTDPNTKLQSATIKVRNYDYDSGELSPTRDDEYTLKIRNLLLEAARVPRFALLMDEIVKVTGLLYKERILMEQIEEANLAGDSISVLEMQLDAVRTQLYVPGVRRFLSNTLQLSHEAAGTR